jgi:hypothetical protein
MIVASFIYNDNISTALQPGFHIPSLCRHVMWQGLARLEEYNPVANFRFRISQALKKRIQVETTTKSLSQQWFPLAMTQV